MSINEVSSRVNFLNSIDDIMKEAPDLFNALANDRFD